MLTYCGRSAHRPGPHTPYLLFDPETLVVTWDLQTGGVVSAIEHKRSSHEKAEEPCITYSMEGKVAILSRLDPVGAIISIFDVVAGIYMHDVNCPQLGGSRLYHIWTHGESIRFVTAKPTRIAIWEVGFALGAVSTEVETLPGPHNLSGMVHFWFLPVSCQAVFVHCNQILVWDARNSKYLLRKRDIDPRHAITSFSDGHFFACSIAGSGVYLWKDSPAGYMDLGKLSPDAQFHIPLLSPNGGSIITCCGHMVRLWHTGDFTADPPSAMDQLPWQNGKFVLDFLPDESLAVFARQEDHTVTVLDLKSGVPCFTIYTSMQVYGLKLIGNTVVVMGDEKAVTWNLQEGNPPPGSQMNVEESTRTINYGKVHNSATIAASISHDFEYIALASSNMDTEEEFLDVYCVSTGLSLRITAWVLAMWFGPEGHNIWCASDTGVKVFTITQDPLDQTETVVDIGSESWGCPWESACGYKVTNDGWIFGLDGKRLLMLPPPWQTGAARRVWNGKFLALLHATLPEPVIIELENDLHL